MKLDYITFLFFLISYIIFPFKGIAQENSTDPFEIYTQDKNNKILTLGDAKYKFKFDHYLNGNAVIYDATGRIIENKKISDVSCVVDLSTNPSGTAQSC